MIINTYSNLLKNKCARRVVYAFLFPDDDQISLYGKFQSYYIGTNSCLNAQEVCPREKGEDYTKCKTICNQKFHAETDVLQKAGNRAKNSIVYVVGHNHCCENCIAAMEKAGVKEVIIYNTYKEEK